MKWYSKKYELQNEKSNDQSILATGVNLTCLRLADSISPSINDTEIVSPWGQELSPWVEGLSPGG